MKIYIYMNEKDSEPVLISRGSSSGSCEAYNFTGGPMKRVLIIKWSTDSDVYDYEWK